MIEEVDISENDENTKPKTADNINTENFTKANGKVQIEEHLPPVISETSRTATKVEEKKLPVEESKSPVVVLKEIPAAVVILKDEGNVLYKAGQYLEAYEKYTAALHQLMEGRFCSVTSKYFRIHYEHK